MLRRVAVSAPAESRATAARQEGCNTRTKFETCRLHEGHFSHGKSRALAWRTPTLHRFRLLGLVEEEVLHAVEHVGVEVLVGPLVQVGRFVQPGGRADAPWRLEGGEGGDAADALRRRAAPYLAEQLAPVVCPRLVVPPGGEQLLVARVASALVRSG